MPLPTITIQIPALPAAVFVTITLIELVWLWSVITIVRQKTPEPSDRIVWLIIVLFFNFLGTIAFMFFYPWEQIAPAADAKPAKAVPPKARPTDNNQASAARADSNESFF